MPQVPSDEWEAFTRDSVAGGRWRYFPTVAELIEELRRFRGETTLEAEAVTAYERILGTGVYTPEGGTTWTYRWVLDTCGKAAAEAFQAAGGASAFQTTYGEDKRRQRFVQMYVAGVRCDPRVRLLGRPLAAMLPSSDDPGFSRDEAAAMFEELK